MRKQQIIWTFLILFLSCKRHSSIISEPQQLLLHVKCDNERYLLENHLSNLEYSFDTIFSTRNYWKLVNQDQAKSLDRKLFPFTILTSDSPSLVKNIKIALVGYGEWQHDSRLKWVIDNDRIDSNSIAIFFERVAKSVDTTAARHEAEIFLSFYKDSLVGLSDSLKKIAAVYIAVQKKNSIKLFKSDLCALQKHEVDSLKRSIPFRIRLGRRL